MPFDGRSLSCRWSTGQNVFHWMENFLWVLMKASDLRGKGGPWKNSLLFSHFVHWSLHGCSSQFKCTPFHKKEVLFVQHRFLQGIRNWQWFWSKGHLMKAKICSMLFATLSPPSPLGYPTYLSCVLIGDRPTKYFKIRVNHWLDNLSLCSWLSILDEKELQNQLVSLN